MDTSKTVFNLKTPLKGKFLDKARANGQTMRHILTRLVEMYVAGEIDINKKKGVRRATKSKVKRRN